MAQAAVRSKAVKYDSLMFIHWLLLLRLCVCGGGGVGRGVGSLFCVVRFLVSFLI